jgi:hypothetical protein
MMPVYFEVRRAPFPFVLDGGEGERRKEGRMYKPILVAGD